MFTSSVITRLFAFVLILAGIVACSPNSSLPNTAAPSKVRVAATTTQVAALAQVVGGDKIDLTRILKANVDPHEYEPQPSDVRAFANAQVIFINGVGLEKWLDKVIQNSGTQAPIVDSSKGVHIRNVSAENPDGDPHIWHAVPNVIIMLNNIRDGLIQIDPANAKVYAANAATYATKLNQLDQYIFGQIATIPPSNRKFVSNHDAFGYYVDRYGLTFVGSVIPGMDTNFEPSAQDLATLVNAIKAQAVKAIFTESSINPSLSRQIAQEAGVKVVDGALYGDTLGPPGSGADMLDGMLKYNTDVIVSNLK